MKTGAKLVILILILIQTCLRYPSCRFLSPVPPGAVTLPDFTAARDGISSVYLLIQPPLLSLMRDAIFSPSDEEMTLRKFEFDCMLVDPAPLTAERMAAIKSDPNAIKTLSITVECKKCHDKIQAYASLERSVKTERQGKIWYANLPETFACHFGGTTIDLSSLKRNMYAPLGNVAQIDPRMASTPLYEL